MLDNDKNKEYWIPPNTSECDISVMVCCLFSDNSYSQSFKLFFNFYPVQKPDSSCLLLELDMSEVFYDIKLAIFGFWAAWDDSIKIKM